MPLLLLPLVACTDLCARQNADGCRGDGSAAPGETAAEAGPWPVAVPLAGCSWLHTAAVTVGEQVFHVSIDSGSATMAIAAEGCATCEDDGGTAFYDTSHGDDEGYDASGRYNTGNIGWDGEVFGDTVGMEGLDPVYMDFGAITDEDYIVSAATCDARHDTPVDGILGLRQDSALLPGTDSFFSSVVEDDGAPDGFALQLCHTGGTLWLGGYDPDATTGEMAFVHDSERSSYSVNVSAFEVQGQDGTTTVAPISDTSDTMDGLLDSGGPNLLIPPFAFDVVMAAIIADPASALLGDAAWWGSYDSVQIARSPSELDALLPRLLVDVAGSPPIQLSLPASESYLDWELNSSGEYEYSRGMSSYDGYLDLGNIPMSSYVVYSDRANKQIGFAPAVPCP